MAEQGSRMLTSGKSERERCISQKNETQLPTRKEGGMDITLDFDEKKKKEIKENLYLASDFRHSVRIPIVTSAIPLPCLIYGR